ncbi:MAG: transcription factor [Cyanobacteria bacterium P01_A01_bin.83]
MSLNTSNEQKLLNLPEQIITANEQEFAEKFNFDNFKFTHNLAGHPLFEIPRLVELADFLLQQKGRSIHFKGSERPVDDLDDPQSNNKQKERVLEELADIKNSKSWLLLYSVQRKPEYRVLLDRVIEELEQLTGQDLRSQITWLDAYIFIASPQGVTPYHIDHESTFLFQIEGNRTSNLFDPRDRSILKETEIENYYAGELKAAQYLPENQKKSSVYQLTPGTGVHHPPLAPHWYQNGEQHSVALGIHFCLKDRDRQGKVHQFNYFLRRLGFSPTPPDKSLIKDRLKSLALELISTRNPKTKSELLRSGVMRSKKIFSLFKSVSKNQKNIN